MLQKHKSLSLFLGISKSAVMFRKLAPWITGQFLLSKQWKEPSRTKFFTVLGSIWGYPNFSPSAFTHSLRQYRSSYHGWLLSHILLTRLPPLYRQIEQFRATEHSTIFCEGLNDLFNARRCRIAVEDDLHGNHFVPVSNLNSNFKPAASRRRGRGLSSTTAPPILCFVPSQNLSLTIIRGVSGTSCSSFTNQQVDHLTQSSVAANTYLWVRILLFIFGSARVLNTNRRIRNSPTFKHVNLYSKVNDFRIRVVVFTILDFPIQLITF